MAWTPTFALPNLSIEEPIDADDIALAPVSDVRVQAFAARHSAFQKFSMSFSDAFGVLLSPAFLLLRDGAPSGTESAEAIAGFRDAVVAATVPISRARWMANGTGFRGAHYSDSFDFHPWSLGRDNKHLVSSTPAQTALHQVTKFRGQSDAHLGVSNVRSYDLDGPLLQELLVRWKARFHTRHPLRSDVALFRALGMASQAMRVAGGVEVQVYDFGRLTGLWTSAFETLMHPGGTAQIKEREVRAKLSKIAWERRDLRHSRYFLRAGASPVMDKGKPVRVSLPALIYFQLSDARNAFLHGNDVSASTLFLRPKGQPLGNLASLLFRMAVADHIGLFWKERAPPIRDVEVWADWFGRHSSFMSPQKEIEDAISIASIAPNRMDTGTRDAVRKRIRGRYRRKPKSAASPPPHTP